MDVLLAGQYAAALTAIAILFGMIVKWVIVKPIKGYIEKMTYPIQPEANSGRSLADISKTVMRIESSVNDLDYRLSSIEEVVTAPTPRYKKIAN